MTQFLNLSEAIDWTRQRWDDRAAPIHLHSRGVEPDSRLGAPLLSARFWRHLLFAQHACTCNQCKIDGVTGPYSRRVNAVHQEDCYHPLLGDFAVTRSCPDCHGTGRFEKRRDVYQFPMTAALTAMARFDKPLRPQQPSPLEVIMAVAMYGWDWRRAAAHLELPAEMFEALALLSFRKLEARYRVGPETRVGWVSMSESQQRAIVAGEEGAA